MSKIKNFFVAGTHKYSRRNYSTTRLFVSPAPRTSSIFEHVFNSADRKRGITIIEVLIALVVMAIVGALAFTALGGFKKDSTLDADAFAVRQMLDEARGATLAARDDARWGVHFETYKAVLYKTSYSAGAADNVERSLGSGVYFSAIELVGGGSDVLFDRLTGAASAYGTTTLSHTNASSTRSIVISPSGIVK